MLLISATKAGISSRKPASASAAARKFRNFSPTRWPRAFWVPNSSSMPRGALLVEVPSIVFLPELLWGELFPPLYAYGDRLERCHATEHVCSLSDNFRLEP